MSKSWPKVRLGEILQERRERPDPDAIAMGKIRIISKIAFDTGKLELRQESETKTGMILIQSGDLVLSGINAAKGAIAIYDKANQDPVAATIHYGAYSVVQERADISYLWWYLRSRVFRELLLDSLRDGIKTELKSSRFLPLQIPLPPLPEQRRIVARIEELAAEIETARRLRAEAVKEADAVMFSAMSALFPESSSQTVGDHVHFQTGYAFKSEWFSENGIRLARNVNIGHGRLDWSETVRIPFEQRPEFSCFELKEGDILVALDRPIISTGVKVARVTKEDLPSLLLQRVARAQFVDNGIVRDYFFNWLRSARFINAIAPGRSNGVPHISHKDIERLPFMLPSQNKQVQIIAETEVLQSQFDALKAAQAETSAELDALLPSILDRAFKGEL